VELEWGERVMVDHVAEIARFNVTPWEEDWKVETNPQAGIDPEIAEWPDHLSGVRSPTTRDSACWMLSWSPWWRRWSTTAWVLAESRTCSLRHSERSAMLDARHPRSVLTAESGDGPCRTLVAPVHADVAVPAYPDDATVHIGDLPRPSASRSRRTTAPTRQGHAGPPASGPLLRWFDA
jgi:hypothetical protein